MADPAQADEMDEIIERYGEVQARFEELTAGWLEARARSLAVSASSGDDGRRRRQSLRRLEDAGRRWRASC